MPVVPQYDTPQVQPQELPGARQQAPFRLLQMADLGPGEQMRTGQQIEAAGAQVGEQAIKDQIQVNEAEVKTRAAQAQDQINARLFDPDHGYFGTHGEAAVKGYKTAFDDVTNILATAGQDLKNPNQQQMWSDVSQRLAENSVNEVRKHALSQTYQWHMDASNALAQSAANTAIANSQSWNVEGSPFPVALQTARKNFTDAAKIKLGIDPATQVGPEQQAQIDLLVQPEMTKVHGGIVSDLLSRGMGSQAQEYLAHYEKITPDIAHGDILPESLDKMRAVVGEGTVLQQAQQSSDTIYGKHVGDEAGAMADARALTDPKVREHATALLTERYNMDQHIVDETQRLANNAGLLVVTNGGSLRKIPPKVWADMSAEGQRAAESLIRENADHARALSDRDTASSLVGLQTLVQFRSANPAAFATLDIANTAKNLGIKSPGTIKQLIEMQGSVNKADAQEASFNSAYTLARKVYGPLLQQAGISALPNASKDAKSKADQNVAQFETQVQGDIQTWMRQNQGRQPGLVDLQNIIKQNLTPVFIHGTSTMSNITGGMFGTDTKKPLYQITPEEAKHAYSMSADDIKAKQPAMYNTIYTHMQKSLGRPPTAGEVEDMYMRNQLRNTK